ncbi:MAG: DUF998 domain-containing protein [Candidatus Hodarchaeota archaeon]
MTMKDFIQKNTSYFGIIGSLVILISSFFSGLAYKGRTPDQPYTIFTYFISELGEIGISELAWLFNVGLLVGGSVLFFFILGLQLNYPSKLGVLAMIIGCYAAISGALVGVFSMDLNDIPPHGITALGFFFGGMIAVLLFSLIILFDKSKRIPKIYSILGFMSTLFFALFIISIFSINVVDFDFDKIMSGGISRPDVFWTLPFFEWGVLISVLAWIILISIHILRKNARE